MKKLIAAALTALMFAGTLTACGNNDDAYVPQTDRKSDSSKAEESVEITEEITEEPTAVITTDEMTVPEVTEAEPIGQAYIDCGEGDYVKLYEKPNVNSTALQRLDKGEAVELYDSKDGWFYVRTEEYKGYVEGAYISMTDPDEVKTEAPTQAPTEAPTSADNTSEYDTDGIYIPEYYSNYTRFDKVRNAYCSTNATYIYKTASTSGAKREVEMLYSGDPVTVYGEYNGFYYISSDNGSGNDYYGYVPADYITIGTPPADPNKSYTATEGVVSSASANVRSTPSKESGDNVVDTIYQGETFTIHSFDGYWYYITYSRGSGYLSYKMVEVW